MVAIGYGKNGAFSINCLYMVYRNVTATASVLLRLHGTVLKFRMHCTLPISVPTTYRICHEFSSAPAGPFSVLCLSDLYTCMSIT